MCIALLFGVVLIVQPPFLFEIMEEIEKNFTLERNFSYETNSSELGYEPGEKFTTFYYLGILFALCFSSFGKEI